MNPVVSSRFTGGAFVAAGAMWSLGWLLLPVDIGVYFEPEVFGRIHEQLQLWIWLYRVHLFGMITAVIAMVAFAAMIADSSARVMIWPGAAVASVGMVVGALGSAFYYHHGVWGAIETAGKSPDQLRAFVVALRVDTEYVTCLVRFGRVFGGLGLVVFAWGLFQGRMLPAWVGVVAGLIGLTAMALTMGLPDRLSLYTPVFYVTAGWLAATGLVVLRGGVRSAAAPSNPVQ
jgi:hypothetical protein